MVFTEIFLIKTRGHNNLLPWTLRERYFPSLNFAYLQFVMLHLPLLKTQKFSLFLSSFRCHCSVIWFHQVVSQCSFLSTTKPFGYVMCILSRTNLRRKILLQHPSDAILKTVCHQYLYDSKRILLWDWIKCLIITYSFLCTELFQQVALSNFPCSLRSHVSIL